MPSYLDYIPTLRFQTTFAVSPDGGSVAYVDDSLGQFNAVVKPLSGGESRRQSAFVNKAVQRVAWHPSRKSLVLLADTDGDEKDQIYVVHLDAGGPVALTERPDVRHIAAVGNPVSPDGRLLAFAGNDRNPVDQDILLRNLDTGETRRVYQGGGQMCAGHWSPDGICLSVFEFRDQESHHIVHLVYPDGRPSKLLTPRGEPATYWLGPWLKDGSGFVVRSNEGREFTGLATMSADTGELNWLDTPDWDVEAASMSEDGGVLVWSVNVDGHSQLRARDMATGEDLATPALPVGAVFGLAVTPDGHSVVVQMSTAATPRNLAVADLQRGEFRWLTDARPASGDATTFVEPELIRYPARDGRTVPAYLYRPTRFAGKRGVLVSIHGGPDHQERPSYMYDGLYQYLLSNGVAILVPNFRGSRGYGKSNIRLIHRNWGGSDLDDFAGAVDYLRAQDWVDPERIGLFGGSYGGFAVLSCLSRLPELGWAAAVDWCGPSNLVTLARLAPPTWRTRVLTMIGDPDQDEKGLLSRSPVTSVDNIAAPLMIIQGANDPRVPKSESDQIVERLRARSIEVRYDVYPDEGHGFSRRENQVKAFSDSAEFLLAHLARP